MTMCLPPEGGADLVVVANRLPVDRVPEGRASESETNADAATGAAARADGDPGRATADAAPAAARWRRSPGGLVTALEPVMQSAHGAWVGWAGQPELELEPFDFDGIRLIPVTLSADDVELYYEGFSNDTIWPLYHDVISPPRFSRPWWDAYVKVNRRFAEAAASAVAEGGTVWVQDYQLQLVPKLLRELRPDVTIGYFHHIPFPPYGLYSQLPWRRQVLEGLLGADVIGFQRVADANNFTMAVRRQLKLDARGSDISVRTDDGGARLAHVQSFPIAIDTASYSELVRRPEIIARAAEIRAGLGNPRRIVLGVDRLDYTKGIRHRIKAYGELLAEGRIDVSEAILVQVASPSRERVAAYMQLRDEIEMSVGRINGTFDSTGHSAIRYLHHSYPREEMAALYLAADVMLVTALRDGMNLVAKEYVAARDDNRGVLVLSEFAGASDELKSALLINPHDIEGLKDTIVEALEMPPAEQARRMRAMRRRVFKNDIAAWSSSFLGALARSRQQRDAGSQRAERAAADA